MAKAGRPPKSSAGPRQQITIKLHPRIREGLDRLRVKGVGNQTEIVEEGIQRLLEEHEGQRAPAND